MITLRRSEDRRHVKNRNRDTWMSFDPDRSADPFRRGFHALENFNEERLASKMSLVAPAREDVEIVTYVLDGSLIQEGSGRLETGEFSFGRPLRLVLNGSSTDSAHVFQGRFAPGAVQTGSPREQKRFPTADREGVLRLVVSPDGRESSLRSRQDVRLYSSVLLLGHHLVHEVGEGRGVWLHVLKGRVILRDHELGAGDSAALEGERSVALTARAPAEVLLFDLA